MSGLSRQLSVLRLPLLTPPSEAHCVLGVESLKEETAPLLTTKSWKRLLLAGTEFSAWLTYTDSQAGRRALCPAGSLLTSLAPESLAPPASNTRHRCTTRLLPPQKPLSDTVKAFV